MVLVAEVEVIEERPSPAAKSTALMRSVLEQFGEYAKLNKKLGEDAGDRPGRDR
jgi:ATP-dependent Lon protease